MNRVVHALAVVALSLSLVAVGGCGEDSEEANKYVRAVNTAQADLLSELNQIGAAATGADPKKTFDSLAAGVDKAVADLEAVSPPAEVKNLHDRLVAEFNRFGRLIRETGKSIGATKDVQKIGDATQRFTTAAAQIQTQVTALITEINTTLQG